MTARAMRRWRLEKLHTAAASESLVKKFFRFQGFIVNFVKRRDAVVPFEQGRRVAGAAESHRRTASRPDR